MVYTSRFLSLSLVPDDFFRMEPPTSSARSLLRKSYRWNFLHFKRDEFLHSFWALGGCLGGGQAACVKVQYLHAEGTLDDGMWKSQQRKLSAMGQALGGNDEV